MTSAATNPHRYPSSRKTQRLGELLIEQGVLSRDHLDAALKHQKDVAPGKLLGEILLEMNLVPPEHLVEVMANSLDIPYMSLTPAMVESEAFHCLPRPFIEKHNLLPLSVNDAQCLRIAVENFTDVFLLEDIGRLAARPIQVVAATGDNIRETREAVLNQQSAPSPADESNDASLLNLLDQLDMNDLQVVEQEQPEDLAELEAAASGSPVVKLVNHIVHSAVEARASDIHIEPDEKVFRVRYRVDGELMEAVRPSSGLLPAVISRIKIMSGMDISERRLPQDGGVTVIVGERPVDLRVSTMATKFGEKVVMRIVDRDTAIRSLDALGFQAPMQKNFASAIQESHGIVLVTGPTGSGKTTTLYSALAEILSDKRNISTIEDPVERRLPGTNQFQVHNAAGFTFAMALRSLLRQDPDIIMVGEIRDGETAKLATEAALTGHLVLSTLHTNDAPTAVPRLVNMGVEPYLLAASLRGVLAQRLVRRICPHCRTAVQPNEYNREVLAELCGGTCPLDVVYTGAGCPRCRGAGFVGRVGVFELLLLNEQMLSSFVRDNDMSTVCERARHHGYTTLLEDGLERVRQGEISVEGLLEIVSRTDQLTTAPRTPDQATR